MFNTVKIIMIMVIIISSSQFSFSNITKNCQNDNDNGKNNNNTGSICIDPILLSEEKKAQLTGRTDFLVYGTITCKKLCEITPRRRAGRNL